MKEGHASPRPERSDQIEDSEGRITDIDIAKEMASREDPYRQKRLGIFKPSEESIAEGEKRAERSKEVRLALNRAGNMRDQRVQKIDEILGQMRRYENLLGQLPPAMQAEIRKAMAEAEDSKNDSHELASRVALEKLEPLLYEVDRMWREGEIQGEKKKESE